MELYEWQKKAIEEFTKKKSLIITAATATGKTVVALEIIKRLRLEDPNYNFLIVCPKIVLIETLWLPKLHEYGITINNVGVYYGYAHEFSKVTITTIASVKKLDLNIFDIIICDEIHNMLTPNLISIVNHNFKYKLGLSASVKGKDNRHWKLLEAFKYNLYDYDIKQALKDGIINKFIFINVGINIIEQDIRDKYDLIEKQIKNLLTICGGFYKYNSLSKDSPSKKQLQSLFNKRNDLIMNYHRKLDVVSDIVGKNKNGRILVFNQYNLVSTKLYWALVGKSVKSEIVNVGMNKDIVDKALKDFNNGKLNVLLTTRQLDEGFDVKGADVCILMASNSTMRQFIQRMGRVLRKKSTPSIIYQVFITNTFEEEYANTKIDYIKDLCEEFIEEEY